MKYKFPLPCSRMHLQRRTLQTPRGGESKFQQIELGWDYLKQQILK